MERSPRSRIPRSAVKEPLSQALRTTSRPLVPNTRREMEDRFHHSFADVQVHDHAPSARDLGARAFAIGNHLAFAPGEYAPGTSHGDHLLAHELAHVVQSRSDAPASNTPDELEVSDPQSESEAEADAAADAVMAGESAPAITGSTAGVVSRSILDYLPLAMGGGVSSPLQELSDAPGAGTQPGPYYYGNYKDAGGGGGYNWGAGRGHAQGEESWTDVFGSGDKVTASGTYDAEKLEGHFGGWSTPKQDGTSDTNVGFQFNGKTPSASGELSYTNAKGQGAYVQGDATGPNFDVSSYAGTGGFGFGAQAAVGGFNVGGGTRGTETDEYNKAGLSEGVGAAVRGNWGDTDGDGFREYGFGFDAGPLSVDMRSEDPLRMAARNLLPGGSLYSDYLLGNGNSTENLANQFGLSTKNADLGTTYDVAAEAYGNLTTAAGEGLDTAGQALSEGYDTVSSGAGELADKAWNAIPSVSMPTLSMPDFDW